MPYVSDIKIAANGRMVLPMHVREAMGLKGESRLIVTVEGDEVRLSPISHVVSRIQSLYRANANSHANVEDFLAERRIDDPEESGS